MKLAPNQRPRVRHHRLFVAARAAVLCIVCTGAVGCTPVKPVQKNKGVAIDPQAGSSATEPTSASPDASSPEHMDAAMPDEVRAGNQAGNPAVRAAPSGGSRAVPPKSPDAMPSAMDAGAAVPDAGAPDMEVYPPRSREPLSEDALFVEAETADTASLQVLSGWSQLPVFSQQQLHTASSQDRDGSASDDNLAFPYLREGNRDLNNFVCKSADGDVSSSAGSASLVPFEFDSNSCEDSYVRGAVLGRFVGSGRMVRFWLTSDQISSGGGRFSGEVLRVYADDNPRAVVQLPLQQVLNGTGGEIFTIPFGAQSPATIAWRYPIAFSSKLVVAIDHLHAHYYYQIEVALDRETRMRAVAPTRQRARDEAHSFLVRGTPLSDAASDLRDETIQLLAGQQQSIELTGPATIEALQLRTDSSQVANLAGVRLVVQWDGAQPAIDVPLLDLFAATRNVPVNSSLALASTMEGTTRVLSLRLPMPFHTSATWTITNTGDRNADFQLTWRGVPKVPSAAFGTLHVQVRDVAIPTSELVHPIAQASGAGRFVGLCADIGGSADPAYPSSISALSSSLDYLNGDLHAVADDVTAIDSTGTEDYADSAYYFNDAPNATPFVQSWGRVEGSSMDPPGQISFCRWHVLGTEIDFQKSLSVTRQLTHHDPSNIKYQHTAAFLYLQ